MLPRRLERRLTWHTPIKVIGTARYGYGIKIRQRYTVSFYPSGSNVTYAEILRGTSRPIESVDLLFLSAVE